MEGEENDGQKIWVECCKIIFYSCMKIPNEILYHAQCICTNYKLTKKDKTKAKQFPQKKEEPINVILSDQRLRRHD